MRNFIKIIAIAFIFFLLISTFCNSYGYGHSVLFIQYDETFIVNTKESKTPLNWSEDIELTFVEGKRAKSPAIAVNDNIIHVVYTNDSTRNVYYLRSQDNGRTWDIHKKVSNITTDGGCFQAHIAINGTNLHVVWGEYPDGGTTIEIYYANSTDNGKTWSNLVPISILGSSDDQWPDIAVWGDNVHVVWGHEYTTEQYELCYRNSTDGGKTWNPIQTIENSAATQGDAHIAVNGSNVHVVWGAWTSGWETYYKKSTDGGITWTSRIALSKVGDWNSDWGRIVVVGNNVHIVWEDYVNSTHHEIRYRNSMDNGSSWNSEKIITLDDGCSSSQPAITVNGSDIHVAWVDQRDSYDSGAPEIYYTRSANSGISWVTEMRLTTAMNYSLQPSIGSMGGYVHLVWMDNRTGDTTDYEIYYKRSPPFGTEPADITITANPDVLTADSVSNSTLTIWVYNETGIPMPDQIVTLSINGSGSVSNVIDNGDGSYTVIYTAGTVAGNMIITATAGSVSNNAMIILKAGAIARIEIDPDGPVTYNKTETCYYTAVGYDIYQNINISWQPIWNVDGNVGVINETGFFTATKEGFGAVNCSDAVTGIYNISLVTVLNRAPTVSSFYPTANITIIEFQNQPFWVNASDDDGDDLTYQWYLNDSLLVDETNSSYTFVPDENFSGNYSVKVSVSDGKEFANHTWLVTVINVGRLQETITDLQNQLNQAIANYTTFQAIMSRLNDNLSSLWNQLNESLGNNTELKNIIGSLSQNLTIIWNELNQSLSNNTSLQSVINQLNDALNLSATQISALWAQLNQSSLNKTALEIQISALNEDITNLQTQIAQLEREKEQAESERQQSARESWVIIGILLVIVVIAWIYAGFVRKKKE